MSPIIWDSYSANTTALDAVPQVSCVCAKPLQCVQVFVTLWTVTHPAGPHFPSFFSLFSFSSSNFQYSVFQLTDPFLCIISLLFILSTFLLFITSSEFFIQLLYSSSLAVLYTFCLLNTFNLHYMHVFFSLNIKAFEQQRKPMTK